jgi:LysM repeat protein
MHKIRTDLEELKHDLNTHQMELHILEGKITQQDDQMNHLQTDTYGEVTSSLRTSEDRLSQLDKRLEKIERRQGEIIQDLKRYEDFSKDIHVALVDYKTKFQEIDKCIKQQTLAIKEVQLVKQDLTSLLNIQEKYIVKSGDSLEKIARKYQVTIDTLRKVNHLTSDLIVVGQELSIPQNDPR